MVKGAPQAHEHSSESWNPGVWQGSEILFLSSKAKQSLSLLFDEYEIASSLRSSQ